MTVWHQAVGEKDGEQWWVFIESMDADEHFCIRRERGGVYRSKRFLRDGRTAKEVLRLAEKILRADGWAFVVPLSPAPSPPSLEWQRQMREMAESFRDDPLFVPRRSKFS